MLLSSVPDQFSDEIAKFCKLYKAKLHQSFNNAITHLIVYPETESGGVIRAKRTVKYLQGMINGIWILSYTWVVHCNGYEGLVKEGDYEINADCFGAFHTARQSRLNGGMRQLLDGYTLFVDDSEQNKSTISKKDLESIIRQSGGTLSEQLGSAKCQQQQQKQSGWFYLVIAQDARAFEDYAKSVRKRFKGNVIHHKWVLDSIS